MERYENHFLKRIRLTRRNQSQPTGGFRGQKLQRTNLHSTSEILTPALPFKEGRRIPV